MQIKYDKVQFSSGKKSIYYLKNLFENAIFRLTDHRKPLFYAKQTYNCISFHSRIHKKNSIKIPHLLCLESVSMINLYYIVCFFWLRNGLRICL